MAKLKDFVITFINDKGEDEVAEIPAYSMEQANLYVSELYSNVVEVECVGVNVEI